ncbi:MAG TPA: alanine--tRNA ligase [Terriglobia bacterium]|nr:alanine--tRNA ligase [Terriglobia bacterium]
MTSSDQTRQTFLRFFADRGHRVVRSSSLVPAGDPTLLFTNAGMNQFKDTFLGREKRDYLRAVTCQKCVRAGGKHNDLEQVGRTTRHHTFFEMLGNFSFGDYFKSDAIPFAWELITSPTTGYGIPADKLYTTIFEGYGDIQRDAEAYDCWLGVGVPADRIFEMGMKDNFWQMGDTGPCGPCSEIHYDMGPAASDLGHTDCKFPCDCGRYVELWNLVFMQFNRDESGAMTPLPRPSIDTGLGLERLSAVLQGKLSNFETDLFRPLIDEAALLAKVKYGANHESDVSLRIIADHARASTFLISDGVLPSNEGRGYVLRLIMRRALYHGQTLGLNEPFLFKMSGHVVDMMKGAYPELTETVEHVATATKAEEERYERTTRLGVEQLNRMQVLVNDFGEIPIAEFVDEPRQSSAGPAEVAFSRWAHEFAHGPYAAVGKPLGTIPGEAVFKLHDTFGLRPEFVEDIARNYRLTLDREGYEAEMQKQRDRARASWKGAEKKSASPDYLALAEKYKTEFFGYKETETRDSRVLALMLKGAPVTEVAPGAEVEIILDRTPFYAEAGGQIGDTGYFTAPGSPERVAEVSDTYRPVTGITAHKAIARETLHLGDLVTARIDAGRRDAIKRNHTATHLLHAALRKVLGTHVKQAGSLVAPDHLRFDFSHYASVDRQDLADIEDLVNEHTLDNEEIRTEVMGIDQALASGAMALFGEKYGDRVRVVAVGDGSFSKELCGGTHVERTGEIGLFKLTSEGSVSAGTRRVEALTGTGLLEDLRRRMTLLQEIEARLKAKPDDLIATLERLEESEKKARKHLEARAAKEALVQAAGLLANARAIDGIKLICARVDAGGADARATLRQMVDDLRPRLGSGVVLLASASEDKVALLVAVSKDLTARLDAGKIVRAAAALVDGSGGGRKDLAEAGGRSPEKLPALIEAVPSIVQDMLKSRV